MKKIKDFGNLTITAYVKFKAQSITINNLSPKKKRKGKDKQNTFIQMVVKNGRMTGFVSLGVAFQFYF